MLYEKSYGKCNTPSIPMDSDEKPKNYEEIKKCWIDVFEKEKEKYLKELEEKKKDIVEEILNFSFFVSIIPSSISIKISSPFSMLSTVSLQVITGSPAFKGLFATIP